MCIVSTPIIGAGCELCVNPISPRTVRGVRTHDIKFAWHGVLAEPFLGRRLAGVCTS